MKATAAVTQTLTCDIGDVTQAVDVTWKDKDNNDITGSTSGYTITKGAVDGSTNIQKSTLTIETSILSPLVASSPVTYKCSAKSTLYPDSEASSYKNLEVTFLSFGRVLEFCCQKTGHSIVFRDFQIAIKAIKRLYDWGIPNKNETLHHYCCFRHIVYNTDHGTSTR